MFISQSNAKGVKEGVQDTSDHGMNQWDSNLRIGLFTTCRHLSFAAFMVMLLLPPNSLDDLRFGDCLDVM